MTELESAGNDDVIAWREEHRYVERLSRATLGASANETRSFDRTASTSSPAVSAVSVWSSPAGSSTAAPGASSSTVDPSPPMSSGRSSPSSKNAPKSSSCSGDIAAPGVAERLVTAAEETGLAVAGSRALRGRDRRQIVAALSRESLERVWAPKAAGALRLHEATATRELDWWVGLLLDVVAAGFARAGGVRLRECVARCPGRVATRIGSACHHDQLGPVVRRRRRPLTDLQCSRSHRSRRRHRGPGVAAGRRPHPGGCRTAAPGSRGGRIPRDPANSATSQRLAEELDVDSDDDDWAGPDALRETGCRRGQPSRHRASGRTHSRRSWATPNDRAIDANQPLTELGMDSLMAVRIRNTVRGDFGVEPPVALSVAGCLAARPHGRSHPPARPQRAGRHRAARTVFAIEPSSVPRRGNEPQRGER